MKNTMNQNNNAAANSEPTRRDPRNLGQYAFDRMFDAGRDELNRLEKEHPGTRRKLAGSLLLGAGTAGVAGGIVLLVT